MRIVSWIFTVAAVVLIIACFFDDELIFFAVILTILAAWTDDWACDIELRDFLDSERRKRR